MCLPLWAILTVATIWTLSMLVAVRICQLWRAAAADADFAMAVVDRLRTDLSAAEARSRGVGGRGEHAGFVINHVGTMSPRMREAMRLAVEVKGKGNG